MRELFYTVLELEQWNKKTCDFCSNFGNKAVCQIRTRSQATDKIVENDVACENCKEKFESNELPKCEGCGKLQTKLDQNIYGNGYTCSCSETEQNKELPLLPHERRPNAFYERQINGLREELNTAEVEIETHLEALEVSEDWHKRQKRELLDRIKELEVENKNLKELTPQELLDEINKLKERVKQLEEQNNQLTAQIEIKPKRPFSFFSKKT